MRITVLTQDMFKQTYKITYLLHLKTKSCSGVLIEVHIFVLVFMESLPNEHWTNELWCFGINVHLQHFS